jgi:hypothetical protein
MSVKRTWAISSLGVLPVSVVMPCAKAVSEAVERRVWFCGMVGARFAARL